MFNIITRATLLYYCKKHPDAAKALQEWYHELILSSFTSYNALKEVYSSVSIVKDERVVFNIMGNKYRVVVRMLFEYKAVQIKWFGTHAEYDKVDVGTVQYKKNNDGAENYKNQEGIRCCFGMGGLSI